VTYKVSASDAVGVAVAPICGPPSGFFFTLGTTVVSCMVRDSAGNNRTGSFTVTVRW
jgi:hypothetical protein